MPRVCTLLKRKEESNVVSTARATTLWPPPPPPDSPPPPPPPPPPPAPSKTTGSETDEPRSRKRKWDQPADAPDGARPPPPPPQSSPPPPPPPVHGGILDPAAIAAAAAAKVEAILARQGIKPTIKAAIPVTYPSNGDDTSSAADPPSSSNGGSSVLNAEHEFAKDIDINDCRNRYALTKGVTQQQIKKEFNADVTTRGKYYPERSRATPDDPPLHLHITAATQEILDAAVQRINELMNEEPGAYSISPAPPQREFKPRELIGPQGSYVKHIQNETGARVTIRGQGSGYIEAATGKEAEEPMHLVVTHLRQEPLDEAVQLAKSLVESVKKEFERVRSQPQGGYYGGYNRGGYYNHQNYYGYNNGYNGQYGNQQYGNYGGGYNTAAATTTTGTEDNNYGAPPPLPASPPPPPPPPPPGTDSDTTKTDEDTKTTKSSSANDSTKVEPTDANAYYYSQYGQYNYNNSNYYYQQSAATATATAGYGQDYSYNGTYNASYQQPQGHYKEDTKHDDAMRQVMIINTTMYHHRHLTIHVVGERVMMRTENN
ncbi:hypothetical protein BDF22DRAFT_657979 [Syncephalis plumigaleata]|nr:hypothetical protein BDF22DRAFT_657979 [Syncephalis plumigaleata]